ncbi:MAG TPA: hypothetical protein VHA13_00465 [Gammaproteobacteria bacterium]|nr:hypothetical protein [Gammaproteobacteria bacterium]
MVLFKAFLKSFVATLIFISFTGCASIVSGHQQSVSVNTDPVKGANCKLENNKGTWYISSTPGSVTINRSYGNLNVECQKKGYAKISKSVPSSTKTITFGNAFLGLVGGPVGGAVDVATGAAYDYPQEIIMPIGRA